MVERRQGDLEAGALRAEKLAGGHAAVGERDRRGHRGAQPQLLLRPADLDAGRGGVDDEGGDTALAGGGIGLRHDDERPGDSRVGDPDLGAVEDIVVAVPAGGRQHRPGVAPRAGLGQAEAPELATAREVGQELRLISSLPNFAIGQQQTEFETLIVTPIEGQMREISSTARQ